jgi:hypothetical protein
MSNDVDECSRSSHCSPAKVCDFVYELESAVSFVTNECRLANPVEVRYEMRNGEGFMRVEPSPHHMLHRLWSACVDMLLIHHMNELKIAEQHLELALGRMTSLCQITDIGDTTMRHGAIIKRTELEQVNSQLSQHSRPAEASTIATGLFEQSIQSLAVLRE